MNECVSHLHHPDSLPELKIHPFLIARSAAIALRLLSGLTFSTTTQAGKGLLAYTQEGGDPASFLKVGLLRK